MLERFAISGSVNSFNPCFNGQQDKNKKDGKVATDLNYVSILVLMDSRIKIQPSRAHHQVPLPVSILVLMDSRIKIGKNQC